MGKLIDETGNKYGRWTVLRKATKEETNGRKGGTYWVCECSCEKHTIKIILGETLRKGESKSCGCLPRKPKIEKYSNLRLGEENINYQSCKMIIKEYISANDVIAEFQDEHKALVHCDYRSFKNGSVKNPFFKNVYGIAMTGDKYPTYLNDYKKDKKEYSIWSSIIGRCFDEEIKKKQPAYKDVVVCNEWLLYSNFYEWLHSQDNFQKWFDGDRWAVDKDILVKHNKIYHPDYCTLVPPAVNALFTKRQNYRGDYPIGVYYYKRCGCFRAQCSDPYSGERKYLGHYGTPEEAFFVYKNYKENLIKEITQNEYNNSNITKKCYEAMMNYVVEYDD